MTMKKILQNRLTKELIVLVATILTFGLFKLIFSWETTDMMGFIIGAATMIGYGSVKE